MLHNKDTYYCRHVIADSVYNTLKLYENKNTFVGKILILNNYSLR